MISHYHVKSSMLIFLFTTARPPLSTPRTTFSLPSFPASQQFPLSSQCLKFRILKSFLFIQSGIKIPPSLPFPVCSYCQNWSPGLHPLAFELLPQLPGSPTASCSIPYTTASLIFFKYNFHHITSLIKIPHDSYFLLYQV